jgi:hypothetical protein
MKKTLINKIKKSKRWFTHNGEEGLILMECVIKPNDLGSANTDFHAFKDLSEEELQSIIDGEKRFIVGTTCYDGYDIDEYIAGANIEKDVIVNPENEQHLCETWETVYNIRQNEAERELTVYTSDHHDWTSELSKFYDSVYFNLEKSQEKTDSFALKTILKYYKENYQEDNENEWESTCALTGGTFLEVIDYPSYEDILERATNDLNSRL